MADRLFMYSWYHGDITRPACESILMAQKPGLFLVRDSSSCKGGYVLSVSENNKVSHYIITNKSSQYQIGDQTFNDLPEIVEFYKRHFLDTTTLVESAPRVTEPTPTVTPAPSVTPPTQEIKVKARYNFPGNDPEDLPFKKNDILTVLKKEEQQWWMARDSMGKEGMIPANYVELLPSRLSYPSNTKPLRSSIHSGGGGYTSPPNVESTTAAGAASVPVIAEAMQDRTPTIYDPCELKFQKGDRILVQSMREDGTWEGQLMNGKKGIFPFTYVKIVSNKPHDIAAWKASFTQI
ncbi:crk-like protein isoform X2 [Hydra vulgaris]|uniref:Crk-like protein isoform X2 n=1 Tax=Hydra vulgaris TaxID=6087 RepID=A0ABM4BY19_HYDVU